MHCPGTRAVLPHSGPLALTPPPVSFVLLRPRKERGQRGSLSKLAFQVPGQGCPPGGAGVVRVLFCWVRRMWPPARSPTEAKGRAMTLGCFREGWPPRAAQTWRRRRRRRRPRPGRRPTWRAWRGSTAWSSTPTAMRPCVSGLAMAGGRGLASVSPKCDLGHLAVQRSLPSPASFTMGSHGPSPSPRTPGASRMRMRRRCR